MNKGFKNLCAAAERQHEKEMYLKGMISRQQTLDKVTIALGRMGFTEDQFRRFKEEYATAEVDFCESIINDGESDGKLVYSSYEIDRTIKEYIPEDMFVPYEERYKFS